MKKNAGKLLNTDFFGYQANAVKRVLANSGNK